VEEKNKQDIIKESASIIEEIEGRLEQILAKKKKEVDQELEEKIKREEIEAKRKMEAIEKQIAEEKESLTSYRSILAEFETEKQAIRDKIKQHLANAIQLQPKIASMAEQTLQELKSVSELHQELERLQTDTLQKVGDLKEDLEKKYGVKIEVPEIIGEKENVKLEEELTKLKKIKELLGDTENQDPGNTPVQEQEKEAVQAETSEQDADGPLQNAAAPVEEPAPKKDNSFDPQTLVNQFQVPPPYQPEKKDIPDISEGVKPAVDEVKAADVPEISETPIEEKIEELRSVVGQSASQDSPAVEAPPQSMSPEEEDGPESSPETYTAPEQKADSEGASASAAVLQQHLKTSDELSYFEHSGKTVLDAEAIVNSINKSVEEARKLYGKLAETESPKEQFFVKQEIIWHQEVLRELMLSSLSMLEKPNCSLPEYTKDVISTDVIKNVLEKVSMENWSNKEYFNSFDDYIRDMKNSFYERITPPDNYYGSIHRELKGE